MLSTLLCWLDRVLPFGTVGGRFVLAPLRLRDPGLPAITSSPLATRFVIGPQGTGWPAAIGRRTHAAHFPDQPPFVVKVFFGCVGSDWLRRSPYADPRSPWHNVFFGAYEVRVDAEAWGRPFAFSEASANAQPLGAEMLRLGKADWNDLSNGLYGVPRQAAEPHDGLGQAWVREDEPLVIGPATWRALRFGDVSAVSAWINPSDGQRYRDHDPLVGALWRTVFGRAPALTMQDPALASRPSFAPVLHGGQFWIRWFPCRSRLTGRRCYRTLVAGTIANEGHPDLELRERILSAQSQALRPFLERASRATGRG